MTPLSSGCHPSGDGAEANERDHQPPRAAYARSPLWRRARMTPDELFPQPTPATRAAREVVGRFSSQAMVNHCLRSYLWSAALGRLTDVAYDAELLYVASM